MADSLLTPDDAHLMVNHIPRVTHPYNGKAMLAITSESLPPVDVMERLGIQEENGGVKKENWLRLLGDLGLDPETVNDPKLPTATPGGYWIVYADIQALRAMAKHATFKTDFSKVDLTSEQALWLAKSAANTGRKLWTPPYGLPRNAAGEWYEFSPLNIARAQMDHERSPELFSPVPEGLDQWNFRQKLGPLALPAADPYLARNYGVVCVNVGELYGIADGHQLTGEMAKPLTKDQAQAVLDQGVFYQGRTPLGRVEDYRRLSATQIRDILELDETAWPARRDALIKQGMVALDLMTAADHDPLYGFPKTYLQEITGSVSPGTAIGGR